MGDVKRNLEIKINRLLELFPAVIIIGSRQCGKTTLVKKIRSDWKYYDLEKISDHDYISNDIGFFFENNKENIVLDEAQQIPGIFNELRSVIDKNRNKKGRFLITGSSSFELIKNVSESLSGRVAIIELGTFKMNEYYEKPLPVFYDIFKDKIKNNTINDILNIKKNKYSLKDVLNCFLKGGYPEPLMSKDNDFYFLWMENYFSTYINRDIRKNFPRLNFENYKKLIMMLTNLSGAIVNRSELGRSIGSNDVTVKEYIDIAHGSFIWRTIMPFEKSKVKSLIKSPKGEIRDSGLVNYIQKVNSIDDLLIYPRVGNLFEAFVIEELIKGIEALLIPKWDYYYYRTKSGAEIDVIFEGNFGLLPIEIKFGTKVELSQLKTMTDFINRHNLNMGIVINNGDEIRLLTDKIIQIPANYI